jgi:hypothetical protein
MNGMANRLSTKRFRLNLLGVVLLIVGLTASAWIFLTGSDDRSDVIGYEVVDGKAYPVTTSDSKLYRHDLERFGGKAAVFADDLARWFAGLWRGRKLALTLAALTIVVTFVCFRAAERIPPEARDDQGR